MTSTRFSLATVQVAVIFVAANFAAIRWGLGLPNLKANGMIQEIVIGGTPMASLLALGAVLAMHGLTRRSVCRSFWIGFGLMGTCALGLFVFTCLRFKATVNHYVDSSVSVLDAALYHTGLMWRIGDHGLRYAIVIAAIVMLLALPQVGLAVLGGWVTELSHKNRRRGDYPEKELTPTIRDSP
jgi:hypothetical protein